MKKTYTYQVKKSGNLGVYFILLPDYYSLNIVLIYKLGKFR